MTWAVVRLPPIFPRRMNVKYMVMSAIEWTKPGCNGDRCFDRNATELDTLEEAERIAAERNAAEKAAGHDNVTWFPMHQLF